MKVGYKLRVTHVILTAVLLFSGGLKIWECTIDLINYLIDENILFTYKNVLDLGCGTGLLGIYSMLKDAVVDFQDYVCNNKNV